jgi:hypothetical protein
MRTFALYLVAFGMLAALLFLGAKAYDQETAVRSEIGFHAAMSETQRSIGPSY